VGRQGRKWLGIRKGGKGVKGRKNVNGEER